jgi:hypothetical protein
MKKVKIILQNYKIVFLEADVNHHFCNIEKNKTGNLLKSK